MNWLKYLNGTPLVRDNRPTAESILFSLAIFLAVLLIFYRN